MTTGVCPTCGLPGVPIVYGLPGDELFAEAAAREATAGAGH
jgi:hypothetical protein